jgi:hypothetical protein
MILTVIVCEGPKCTKGKAGQRVFVELDSSRAQDPTYCPPDEFFRFIITRASYEEPKSGQQQSALQEHQFCSINCLRDFYNESRYTPPLSPREQAKVLENNAAVEQARQETVDGFGKPQEQKTAKILQFPKQVEPAPAPPAEPLGENI